MNIAIFNTECSNLSSVKNAIQRLGYKPIVTNNYEIILNAKKLILPGIGTAKTVMQQLIKKNMINTIKNCTQHILGICLGMQILGSSSEENGGTKTLNIIDTPVQRMIYSGLPLPHMGWNTVMITTNHPLFFDINNNSYFYFIHSYAMPICYSTIATTHYGRYFTSVLNYKNFFGVQFHPERSGSIGQKLLQNFLEM